MRNGLEPSTLDIVDEQADRLPLPARWSLVGVRVVLARHYTSLTLRRSTTSEDNFISLAADRYSRANRDVESNITGVPSYCHQYFLNFVAAYTWTTLSSHPPYGYSSASSYPTVTPKLSSTLVSYDP